MQFLVLTFNGSSGRLRAMHSKLRNISTNVDQNFFWWRSNTGGGAYVFSPVGTIPEEITPGNAVLTTVINVMEKFQLWI